MKPVFRLLPLGLLAALSARAQNELSNFTATGRGGVVNTFALDYQAIGINPANLGRQGETPIAFTVGEGGVGVGSQQLSRTFFRRILFEPSRQMTPAERVELASMFAGDNALNLNADLTTVGFSINLPSGLGGLAFSNRVRGAGHLALNRNAAEVAVYGQDAPIIRDNFNPDGSPRYYNANGTPKLPLLSQALDGTAIQLAVTSEYNLSYGVRVLDLPGAKISAGAGYRFLQGLGIADVRISGGEFVAYNAMNASFNLNYRNLLGNPNFNAESGRGLSGVGHGNGFDLGLAAEIGKVVRLGVSVTDLGQMTWKGNLITANDQALRYVQGDGINTYDVIRKVSDLFQNSDGLFQYQAGQERKAALPAKFRAGAGVRISELFEAGLDVTAPLNQVAGNLTAPFVGVGLDYKPVRWVRLSSGLSGGAGYKAALPLGVTFVTPVWEAGVSTRDVTGYFAEKTPYVSAAAGFLRFKVGKL